MKRSHQSLARPELQMLLCLAVLFAPGLEAVCPGAELTDRSEFFETRIRPVLVEHCYSCHSSRSQELQGDLRLDRNLTKSVPLVKPGDPGASRLIEAIRYTDSDLQMPPTGRLPAKVIADFEAWVKTGAFDPRPQATEPAEQTPGTPGIDLEAGRRFWAFQPVRRGPPPDPDGDLQHWVRSPVDAFILKRLQAAGLRPGGPADRRTLIRRASFALTGLPPTPDQVQRFVEDARPGAFAVLIDRLLASPDYGERWGRHWLDVVRYGDCNGADESRPFPNAWHFRNYVIETFNRDLPYDRMIAEHLAGDLLEHDPEAACEPLVGTGFLVLGTKILAEQDQKKMGADIIDEQIDVFSRSFLALTLACARCHDHKFDPIPTTDYYALAGIFQSTKTMSGYGQWMERPAHTRESLAVFRQTGRKLPGMQARLQKLRAEIQKSLKSAETILIEAESLTRGDAVALTTGYGQDIGIIGDRGDGQLTYAEYDIEPPEAGRYLLQLRYAAAQARPGKISLNAKVVIEPAISQVTGDWYPAGQRWFSEGVLNLRQGLNTVRLESRPNLSHIDKLRLVRLKDGSPLTRLMSRADSLEAETAALEKRIQPPLKVMAVAEGEVTRSKVHIRGSHLRPGPEVPRRFLQVIAGVDQKPLPEDQSGRLQLAAWLARPDHPLTSRVMVNRLWRWHFGRGIVATPDNFGQQGSRPSHPELLDYLARRFVEQNWSIKAMHREIMLSSTWQMAGTVETFAVAPGQSPQSVDPENRLYWKAPRRRLEAESIRDALLAVSGRLDSRGGGAPLTLKTIALSPEDLAGQEKFYNTSNRRTVYLPVLRTNVYDFLTLFDFANPDLPTGSRVTTTVPTQALLMMNSPLVEDCARRLAARVLNDPQLESGTQRLEAVYLRLFSRPPLAPEQSLSFDFLNASMELIDAGEEDRQLGAWSALCRTLMASNEFVYLR